jgi:hypothetical protein
VKTFGPPPLILNHLRVTHPSNPRNRARLRPFGSRFSAPVRLRSVGGVASTRTESLTLRPEGAGSRQGNGPHADDEHQQRKPKADPGG